MTTHYAFYVYLRTNVRNSLILIDECWIRNEIYRSNFPVGNSKIEGEFIRGEYTKDLPGVGFTSGEFDRREFTGWVF